MYRAIASAADVEGTLKFRSRRIETAIERTARSPMIREAPIFASGDCSDRIAQAQRGDPLRRLPNGVVRDVPPDTMKPSECLMNDLSHRGQNRPSAGSLPQRAGFMMATSRYIQAFGHHDDVGGRVPGQMPGKRRRYSKKASAIPPVKDSEVVRNDAVFTSSAATPALPERHLGRSRQ